MTSIAFSLLAFLTALTAILYACRLHYKIESLNRTEVRENITKEEVDKKTLDQTLTELLQRETVWVESVEKNFRSQLGN
jgi:hypothetical protein